MNRTEQFRADIADLRLPTGRQPRESLLQAVSVVLMVAGVAIAFGAYEASLNVTATPGSNIDVLNSNSELPLAVTGLAISVVGGFLFLRYSLARFLRFWLLRQSYEQRLAIDEAAARAAASPTPDQAGRDVSDEMS